MPIASKIIYYSTHKEYREQLLQRKFPLTEVKKSTPPPLKFCNVPKPTYIKDLVNPIHFNCNVKGSISA